ncbi:dihydrodipicolinate synthase family protein [Nakamurella flava]|uniref:Dihydrodipicolinate synthase family protein n=1 Tax=Nakamurella flava TaxID=2576308 RepID=A0A4U6QLK5_9ACTN|nr:dihydrodipicolinate synthase family protein [Nakamurella flava]TKV61169.1 dihydrodipicolinate synthase family protein [Nakamurella flava]
MTGPRLASGVWGVVATPFTNDLQVDERSLRRLVRHYADIGVTGLTVLGVFGEAAALDADERAAVLRAVVDEVDLPLTVGLTSLATAPGRQEATAVLAAAGDRVAAVMVQVNSPVVEIVVDHLDAISTSVDLPVVVQDYPVASGITIAIPALRMVVQTAARVAAVKAEAPPTPPAIAALSDLGVPVFGGLGGIGLLDELACGSAGAMTGFSYPEALLDCVAAHRSGGFPAARAVFAPWLPLVTFEQQARIALAIRKQCLVERGLIDHATVRPPAASLPDALRGPLRVQMAAAAQLRTGRPAV